MIISDDFPILQKSNSIFLVAGKQFAVIYRLYKGEINERDTVFIQTPQYTDREGYFEHRGPKGTLHGSGSVYEPKNQYINKKFISSLMKELKGFKRPYNSIYLFAPMQTMHEIEQTLPQTTLKKIKGKFTGNFTKQSPTDLLKKVKNLGKFKAKLTAKKRVSFEASKILSRGKRISKKAVANKKSKLKDTKSIYLN